MNKDIDGVIFQRLNQKLEEDKDVLISSRQESYNESGRWLELNKFLSKLTSLQVIYNIASLTQKQALIRKIFFPELVYSDNTFRAFTIEPAFRQSTLIAVEKKLLVVG
jgi:hypothetical protein